MNEITKEEEARFIELCHIAFDFARNDEPDELAKMLDAGLSVNLKTEKGDTLLMIASYNGSIKTTDMLLRRGAAVDERNNRGQTPLAGACFKGYLEVVKLLISHGADINANNGMGATPYTFAVMFGRSEVVKYLDTLKPKRGVFSKLLGGIFSIFTKSK